MRGRMKPSQFRATSLTDVAQVDGASWVLQHCIYGVKSCERTATC